jgi:fibronectin type 3 domain-containing protein
MANHRKLMIILILVGAIAGFGIIAQKTVAAFVDLSLASVSVAGVETDSSFDMTPVKITGLSAQVENGSINIHWRALRKTRLNGYRIYRGNAAGAELIIGSSTQPSFADSDVEKGKVYYYRVSAVNDLGEGYLSSSYRVEAK